MTEPGARPTQVMWSQFLETDSFRKLSHYNPHDLLCYASSPNGTGLTDTAKQPTRPKVRRGNPSVDRTLYPCWDRNGSDVSALANQVHDYPAILPLLNIFEG